MNLKIFGKSYGILSFTKKYKQKVTNEYSQKFLDHAKQSATDALNTVSKRAIKK